ITACLLEVDRRRRLSVTCAERAAAIKDTYRPLHPHVYQLQEHIAETHLHPPPLLPRSKVQADSGFLPSQRRQGGALGDLLQEEAGYTMCAMQ
ncbi:hypothetical protein NQZ68_027896, partial [Dissostichus eleginoides]